MAGPEEEMPAAVQSAGVKRSSVDIESLQRKKFKADELPLTAAQHGAIDSLLHAFKKKGGFDTIRKKMWAEFHDGEGKAEFTKLLIELAESEIEREPELLSRERGKAATLIEGAVDRSDIYKTVEKSLDALASNHLPAILDSVREIRRQEVGEEIAAREEQGGNKTDEDFAAHVKTKRDEREKIYQEEMRKQKEIEEEQKRRKAEEDRKQRELERKKEEEERARRREREEQRRAEQRLLDEQREKERQERYERRRREERERFRDYDRYRDRDRSRTRDRDFDRDRDRDRYRRDRSPGYRSDRAISPRHRESRKETSETPKEPTPAPPVDEKSLEEAALQMLLKEGEELAAKARQKPEFDFEEAEAIENGLKPPPKPKTSDSRYSNTPTKSGSPAVDADAHRRLGLEGGPRDTKMSGAAPARGQLGRASAKLTTDFPFATSGMIGMVIGVIDQVAGAEVDRLREGMIVTGTVTTTGIVPEVGTAIEAQTATGNGSMTRTGATEVETETGGSGTETEMSTGIGRGTVTVIASEKITAAVAAGLVPGIVHVLVAAHALALGVGREIGNGSVIVLVTMVEIVTGTETEKRRGKETVSQAEPESEKDPPRVLLHPLADDLARGAALDRDDDPQVFLISTATYHRPATEAGLLGDGSVPQSAPSVSESVNESVNETTGHAS
ncbi:hypothetical protein HFD88_006516 [Aspergillus terreus]|nr:hypothetical protein HFD88_006516 [Aspergillus terreus]